MTTTTRAPERTTTRTAPPGAAHAAVIGALLLAACNAVSGWVLSRGEYLTTEDFLGLVDAHRTPALVADGTGLIAALLLVPGAWAVAQRLADRSPVLAGIGGWLTSSGYVAFMVLVIEGQVALALLESGGDLSTYVDAMDNHGTVVQLMIYVTFGVGALIGPIVLGVAMLRQRDAYPVWAALALLLSPVVRMGGLVLGLWIAPPVASLMLAVGFAVVLFSRRR